MTAQHNPAPLLEVEDLRVEFATDRGRVLAVNGIDLTVSPGEIVGVVGESGSGKSVTALSILGLVRPPGRLSDGAVRLHGQDLTMLSSGALQRIRGGAIAMIFQDPMTALNPVVSIGAQIVESLRLHQPGISRATARARAVELLNSVHLPDADARCRAYPHELSGGMRQRVMVAMALANDPELLIADEPTTALDVTIQAQVLDLLRHVRRRVGTAIILISHDLGVIAELADRVLVIYAGRIVEQAEVGSLFRRPRHPYTHGLLASSPRPGRRNGPLKPIPGSVPIPLNLPVGCAFHPRCSMVRARCRTERPALREVVGGHWSACHYADEMDRIPDPIARKEKT